MIVQVLILRKCYPVQKRFEIPTPIEYELKIYKK